MVATVIPTEPSTTNLAGPSAVAGSRSWMTSTNAPASASRMKIAVWLCGHSPVTPTMVVAARRNTHDAMRTTRS